MVAPALVRRRRGWALVVSILGASAVGRTAPQPAPPAVTEETMLVETEALARAVGEARKGRVVVDWERRLVDRAQARATAEAIVRAGVAAGGGRADTDLDAQVFQRLGLLSAADAPYADLISDAVARDPVACYDPAARRLYVPSYLPLAEQRPVLAHEIAHALQDQRFGLRRFLKITPDGRRGLSFDAELARQALIEGDAAVLALEALDPKAPFPAPPELGEVAQRAREGLAGAAAERPESPVTPRFLHELLAFPTVEGFAFVARARGRATWAAIDGIWAHPPESTAQILHPEKYDRRLAPPALEIPPLPLMGDGLRWARAETFGELLLRVWLSSERAATGWRGDRMAIYLPVAAAAPASGAAGAGGGDGGLTEGPAPGGGAALAWLTAWDGEADADDFLQTAVPRLAALAAGGAAPEPGAPADSSGGASGSASASASGSGSPVVWRARADDTIYAAARRGALVALLLGAPPAALPSLAVMLDPGAATPRGRARDAARKGR